MDAASARDRLVFHAMERILDSEIKDEAALIALTQPFSGQEYLQQLEFQAVEERSLGGECGNPMCSKLLAARPLEKLFARQHHDPVDDLRFCSPACERPVRQLADMLGSVEAATLRFSSESGSLPDHRHAELLRKPPSRYAAGGKKTPIMLANVVERSIANPPQAMDMTNSMLSTAAVDGYVPKNYSASTAASGGASRAVGKSSFQHFVRFADADVRDGTASGISLSPGPASSQATNTNLETPEKDGRLEGASDLAEPCDQPLTDASDDNATECSSHGDERKEDSHLSQHSASDHEDAFQDEESEAATFTHDRSFPWYHKAPDTGATVLTLFGQLHIALDELVTEAAVRYCTGQEAAVGSEMDDRQAQVLLALERMVDESLTNEMILMLRLPVKPDVSRALQGLLRLLNLNALLPSLEADGWTAMVVIFLKALSMGPHPELQASFEGRKRVQKVAEYLDSFEIDYAEFETLLELLS